MNKVNILILLTLISVGFQVNAKDDGGNKKDRSLIVPGKVIVKMKPGSNIDNSIIAANPVNKSPRSFKIENIRSAFESYKRPSNAKVISKSGIDFSQYYILEIDQSLPIDQILEEIRGSNDIEYAEPLFMHRIDYTPNDTEIGSQTYLGVINAFDGWEISKGSADIIIAIVDSGVDYEHPDLTDKIYLNDQEIPDNGIDDDDDGYIDNYYGWDFAGTDYRNVVQDNNPIAKVATIDHGTAVAGCAAASTDNGLGVAGIGFNSKFMALKCSAENDRRDNGSAYLLNTHEAVLYAADHGADVINMSYGSSYYSQFEQDIMTYAAVEKGVVLIAAAGNAGNNLLHYPSAYEHVLSVAATDDDDIIASFTTFGTWVDISAPGVEIYTTFINNEYGTIDGTSFSSPITAGAAALLIAQFPDYTPIQIHQLIKISTDNVDALNPNFAGQLGTGRLNIGKALSSMSPAFRITNFAFGNDEDRVPAIGETGYFSLEIINDLVSSSANAELKVTQLSGAEVILDNSEFSLALIASGEISTFDPLFSFVVPSNANFNEQISLNLEFSDPDNDYLSNEIVHLIVNPIVTPSRNLPYLVADGGNFEVNTDDFVSAQLTGGINLWEHGVPGNALTVVNSGINAWKTDLDGDLLKEDYSCVLQTPVFDFTQADKEYLVSFYKSMEMEFCNAPAAVQVQYTLDGQDWIRLGSYGDFEGTNWYDKNPEASCAIDAQILPDQQGWLGNFINEFTSYDVSFLAGNSEVTFRFLLQMSGAFESEVIDDGFMIDDFEVNISAPTAKFDVDFKSVAIGRELQFTYKGNGALTFDWNFGDGSSSTDENPVHAYATSGKYDVSLTITSAEGSDTQTKTNFVNILNKYAAPYTPDDGGSFDVNQNDFIAENVSGTPFELGVSEIAGKDGTSSGDFAWVTGIDDEEYVDLALAYLYTPSFDMSGASSYKLSFKSNYSFEDNWDGFIVEYSVDLGETWIKLNDTVEEGWYNQISDDGSIFGESTPIFSGDTGGRFDEFATSVTFLSGNQDVMFRFMFRSDWNTVDVGMALDDFSLTTEALVDAAPDFTFAVIDGCDGQTVTFTDSSSGDIANYFWDFGIGASPENAVGRGPHLIVYSASEAILSTVTLTVDGYKNGEISEIKTDLISTAPDHKPTITEVGSGSEGTFELQASVGDSYQWYKGNQILEGETDQIYIGSEEGNYKVEVSIDGCVGVSNFYSAEVVTTINLSQLRKLTLYPNPTSGLVKLSRPEELTHENLDVLVLDLSGRVVYQRHIGSTNDLDLSHLMKGTYLINFSANGNGDMRRIVLN